MIEKTELTNPIRQEATSHIVAELYIPGVDSWEGYRNQILELDELCFPGNAIGEEYFKAAFESTECIIVLLKQNGVVIGFSCAQDIDGDMYIVTTNIHPEHQGKGLVGNIMKVLEDEAAHRGYEFITREASIKNGYADSISKHYADRIVKSYDQNSDSNGLQRYFKIRINSPIVSSDQLNSD